MRANLRGMGQVQLPAQSMAGPVVARDFFTYNLTFLALAAAGTATATINIDAGSDFVLQKLTYFADVAAAAQTDSTRIIPLATVLITDNGSNRQMMDAAVPIVSLFGTGEIPFILAQPKVFVARSTVSVAVANFSAATAYNIRLAFVGMKVYRT